MNRLFNTLMDDPLDNVPLHVLTPETMGHEARARDAAFVELEGGSRIGDGPARPAAEDLKNQFVVFQIGKGEEPALLEATQVAPSTPGGEDQPDILASMSLTSFRIGASEGVDPGTRATMRITAGKDRESSNQTLDAVFWSAAVGLNLYDQAKGKKADGKELNADLKKAFNNRPIEIPGGLASLQFEVVKHEEPKWWRKLLAFGQSGTGQALTAAVGFPAVTQQAISLIDGLLERLTDSNPEVLFKSMPLRLALTQYARDELTAGNSRIKVGCLNPGYCVLARARDYATLVASGATYWMPYDRLVPGDVTEEQLLSGGFEDPFEDMTYAVFRVGTQTTKIDPRFNWGG